MKLRVIVNPRAGAGRAGRNIERICRALDRAGLPHDVVTTRGPGDATQRARDARNDGIECIAVVGGDGTVNEVAQAYLDDAGNPVAGPELALIPAGTGGDFRKTFGLPDDFEAAVTRLRTARARPLDLGILELTGENGERKTCSFLNIASFGISGLADRIVNNGPKWLGGRAAFFLGTLRAMLVYRDAAVRVKVDGKDWLEGPIFNVAIANGRFFGGGMQIAPNASAGDGLFDVVSLSGVSRATTVGLSRHIYRGTHLDRPGVRETRAARVDAEPIDSSAPVLIDMDGETPGQLPLSARVVKGALSIRA